jgi:hypothetical protein
MSDRANVSNTLDDFNDELPLCEFVLELDTPALVKLTKLEDCTVTDDEFVEETVVVEIAELAVVVLEIGPPILYNAVRGSEKRSLTDSTSYVEAP